MPNTAENCPVINERVDDLPLLLAQLKEMRVPELLNEAFPTHGNWRGLSLGHVVTVWLTFILSESNHRLSHLRPWAAGRLQTLRVALGVEVVETDFTDDRLAQALEYLSANEKWQHFEDPLNRHLLRIYDLTGGTVRLDSTTAQSYGEVSVDGLLRFGHSKDHRPDLPQIKISVSTLDPLGLPLTATIVSGDKADDPLYVPEIERVRATLQRRGLLYVGDSKMAALATRVHLAAGGDSYLCPLPATQIPAAHLAEVVAPVVSGAIKAQAIKRRNDETGRWEKIAQGYEYPVTIEADHDGQRVQYVERRLVVCSLAWAKAQKKGLAQRVKKAAVEITRLNQKKQGKVRPKTVEAWQTTVAQKLHKYRVVGLLDVTYREDQQMRAVRAYKERPATVRVVPTWQVEVTINRTALAQAQAVRGWRVYATNAPQAQVSLTQAVLAYRGSPVIERGFRRLKGPLSLTPLYLTTTARLTGLVRVLLIGLRVLGLIEYKARRALAVRDEQLAGLTKGLPKKATARPTTETLLRAFEGLTLSYLGGQWYLTPLNALQTRILDLLDFSSEIYHRLIPRFLETQMKMSET